jgi:hypothetical protein
MAQKRSEMRRVKEVLRLRLAFGLSHKAISAACRMPRATVRDYCQRAKAAGIDSFAAVEPLSGACLIQRVANAGGLPCQFRSGRTSTPATSCGCQTNEGRTTGGAPLGSGGDLPRGLALSCRESASD